MASERAKKLLKDFPGGSPREDVEQIGLFELFDMQLWKWPELALAYHIPNGGKRGKAEAGRFKAMGVKKGMLDIHLPVARRGFFGMYIEMKRLDGRSSDVRKSQIEWIVKLEAQGYHVVVAYGAAEAWKFVKHYLEGARTITKGIDHTGKMP